jgi:hypothetical protein
MWGLVLYPFYGFMALFGSGNDQFFYFLLIPAILFMGYVVSLWTSRVGGSQMQVRHTLIAGFVLVVILPSNVANWWSSYGIGVDDGYRRLASYVVDLLPEGEAVNATGDAIKFQYFLPEHPIASAATPDEARAIGVHYFALSPKDVRAHYGRITPELATWIASEGHLLHSTYGDSYEEISFYRIDYDDNSTSFSKAPEAKARQRSFGPAQSGFIGSLALALGLWSGIVGAVAVWLIRWPTKDPVHQSVHRRSTGPAAGLEVGHERS